MKATTDKNAAVEHLSAAMDSVGADGAIFALLREGGQTALCVKGSPPEIAKMVASALANDHRLREMFLLAIRAVDFSAQSEAMKRSARVGE